MPRHPRCSIQYRQAYTEFIVSVGILGCVCASTATSKVTLCRGRRLPLAVPVCAIEPTVPVKVAGVPVKDDEPAPVIVALYADVHLMYAGVLAVFGSVTEPSVPSAFR